MYQEFSCIQIKVHVARTHVNENFGSVFFSFKTFNQPEKVQLFYTGLLMKTRKKLVILLET